MKKLITLLLVNFSIIAFSQTIVGSWQGELNINGQKLPLIFHIKESSKVLSSTFDSPLQNAKDIPFNITKYHNNEILLEADNLGITYKGKLLNKKILGEFEQGNLVTKLDLTPHNGKKLEINRPQTPKSTKKYHTEDINFINPKDNNKIAGTLTTPKLSQEFPIVILISGSGTQNRDGEIFDHRPFAVIADYFANNNIATLRLDDRGIGGSTPPSPYDTTENFASDINSAVNFLSSKGYKEIGLIGHSEGGLIAPMVANDNPKVKFIITLAAPGIPISELMILQNDKIGRLAGLPDTTLELNKEINTRIYQFIKDYKGSELQNDITNYIEKEIQVFPKERIAATVNSLTHPWYKYFISYNPQKNLEKITIPLLAINGEKDIQVSSKENLNGIEKSLKKAGNTNYKIMSLPNLNHLFQTAKTGSVAEYSQIEETFSPHVLTLMKDWIFNLKY